MRIKAEHLSERHFRYARVWEYVDEEDSWEENNELRPVLESVLSPDDLGLILIKADFWSADGHHFNGYVVSEQPYAIGLYVNDREFVFNVNLKKEAVQQLSDLRRLVGNGGTNIFPLIYKAQAKLADGGEISGEFDPFKP